MRLKRTDTGEELGVQMAPLIDCVFLLLIYFLCTGQMTKPHKDLGIDLPTKTSEAKDTKSPHDTLVVEVTKDGTIYLDSQPMTTRLLHDRLREVALKTPERRVRLDADRTAAFTYLSPLLDLLQFNNLNNVGLRTKD